MPDDLYEMGTQDMAMACMGFASQNLALDIR